MIYAEKNILQLVCRKTLFCPLTKRQSCVYCSALGVCAVSYGGGVYKTLIYCGVVYGWVICHMLLQ